MKNILEYFEGTVARFPDKVGFTDDKQEVTFAQAQDRARRIASGLARYGFRRPG